MTTSRPTEITIPHGQHYCCDGDTRFAGRHLLIEMWNSPFLDNQDVIDKSLRNAIHACGATLLSMHLHEFSPEGGISGVGILAESHISIHTWPEYNYAALDLFTCGTIDPKEALVPLRQGLQPESIEVQEIRRGILP